MQKTVEKILFRVAGVTKYKKEVKEACNLIAEDNGIPEYAKYYSNLSTKEIREEVEEYGLKVFKYRDLDIFNIELIPEMDNKYDPNAIKVLIFNNHVGYVPATVAKTIRKYFDNKKYNFVIEGEIKGGPYKEWDDLNDKVITNNDLDIGFEIYLSVIDSTIEESNEISLVTPIENVVREKTEEESPDLVQLSKPTIPIEGNALNVADPTQFTTSVETTPKKESPTIKSIILSIVGLLFLLASLSLLFEGKIGPFFIGLIISYILIRPIIKYIKK